MPSVDPQFQFGAVMAIFEGKMSLVEICQEYGLDEKIVETWKAAFLKTIPTLFLTAETARFERPRLKEMVTPWFDRDEGVWKTVFSRGQPDVV